MPRHDSKIGGKPKPGAGGSKSKDQILSDIRKQQGTTADEGQDKPPPKGTKVAIETEKRHEATNTNVNDTGFVGNIPTANSFPKASGSTTQDQIELTKIAAKLKSHISYCSPEGPPRDANYGSVLRAIYLILGKEQGRAGAMFLHMVTHLPINHEMLCLVYKCLNIQEDVPKIEDQSMMFAAAALGAILFSRGARAAGYGLSGEVVPGPVGGFQVVTAFAKKAAHVPMSSKETAMVKADRNEKAKPSAVLQYLRNDLGRAELLQERDELVHEVTHMPSRTLTQISEDGRLDLNEPLIQAVLEECLCENLACRAAYLAMAEFRTAAFFYSSIAERLPPPDTIEAEHQELVELRAEHAALHRTAKRMVQAESQINDLNAENINLRTVSSNLKHRFEKAESLTRERGVQKLKGDVRAGNSKIEGLQQTVNGQKNEIEVLNARIAALTANGSTSSLTPEELAAIDLRKFKPGSQSYERESDRLLKHLGKGLKEIVARAKGIEDRNGSGWSAYERLESLLKAFKILSNDSIATVLDLERDKRQGEPGVNSMGLPILNIKKGK